MGGAPSNSPRTAGIVENQYKRGAASSHGHTAGHPIERPEIPCKPDEATKPDASSDMPEIRDVQVESAHKPEVRDEPVESSNNLGSPHDPFRCPI